MSGPPIDFGVDLCVWGLGARRAILDQDRKTGVGTLDALTGRGHRPETGPDRPRAPDEAGVPLESEMARNHRSVNKSFNRPGTPARNRPRPAQGPR